MPPAEFGGGGTEEATLKNEMRIQNNEYEIKLTLEGTLASEEP